MLAFDDLLWHFLSPNITTVKLNLGTSDVK